MSFLKPLIWAISNNKALYRNSVRFLCYLPIRSSVGPDWRSVSGTGQRYDRWEEPIKKTTTRLPRVPLKKLCELTVNSHPLTSHVSLPCSDLWANFGVERWDLNNHLTRSIDVLRCMGGFLSGPSEKELRPTAIKDRQRDAIESNLKLILGGADKEKFSKLQQKSW